MNDNFVKTIYQEKAMYKTRESNVSIGIRQTMASYKKRMPLIKQPLPVGFSIKIANTQDEREAAFRLAYQVYLEKGYVNKNSNEWLVKKYDSSNETVILIVQDQLKNIVGSLTIVFDGSSKLPAEKLYAEELKTIRSFGNKMAELSRLVISPEYRNSKEILVLLFNYSAIYILQVNNYNSLAIQVNPRHKKYYKSLLNFDEIGTEKLNPQVANAPAVLLYLSERQYQTELNRSRTPQNVDKKERSLYPYFLNAEQEDLVAYYLAKQTKPMTSDEKIYFGFTESGVGQAVGV